MENLTQAEYIKNPGRCPVCRSTDIEGGFINVDGATASQRVNCLDCDAEWTDTYTLVGYTELETQ